MKLNIDDDDSQHSHDGGGSPHKVIMVHVRFLKDLWIVSFQSVTISTIFLWWSLLVG